MTARYIIGDTRDVVASLPDGSVDLVLTSPPFLALRSYLPADHPDKWREIGSEATPAAFLDTLLELTAEWGRVLAPHGMLAVELGDTYSGGWVGDSTPIDERLNEVGGPRIQDRRRTSHAARNKLRDSNTRGWPLPKSKALIPELYRVALAYGINPLTGQESPAGRWRVRNVVTWCRPNPPVGALGDKFRPATSDMVIACRASDRWFDLDAVRTEPLAGWRERTATEGTKGRNESRADGGIGNLGVHPAGAPPLDYWVIPPGGYSGTTTTTRRVPCGPHDGGERTTSPDCPVHGGQPDQAPTGSRGAHAETSSSRTPCTDGRHEPMPLPGFGTTGSTPGWSDSSHAPTSAQSDPGCSDAATTRSTPSNRTGRAPATTAPCTPSAETTPGTGRTSASPESTAPHPDTPVSSTSPADSGDLPSHQTTGGTDGTPLDQRASSSACSCSFHRVVTESTSHYAVYPPELCRIPIEAMCPRQVCTVCGKPRRRIVGEAEYVPSATHRGGVMVADAERLADGVNQWVGAAGAQASVVRSAPTLGWTDCGHDSWRPGIVLDPFGGSGTTGVVAVGLGRDAILVDIDDRNAELARERIGMFLEVEDRRPVPAPSAAHWWEPTP